MRCLTIPVLLAVAAPAAAQYPPVAGQPPGGYMPNYYNRQTQPLSPYLNLLRGGNPGVNYYYGVRPGTGAGGMNPTGQYMGGPFAGRTQFLPQASQPYDPAAEPFEPGGKEVRLAPAGHQVVYGNTFNGHGSYYSVYAQTGVRPQSGMAAPKPGPVGLGAGSPRPAGGGGARR